MKKKITCVFLALAMLCTAFLTSAYAAEDETEYDYHDALGEFQETVIEIKGLSQTYKFMHIADSHVVNISSNTSSFYYAESIQRYNHFMTIGGGLPARERLDALYAYAEDPVNDIDCVWLTGDNIDFPSTENVSYITNLVNGASVDHLYCFGNHDWTYPSHYFDNTARNSYRPLLTNAMGGNNCISYRDYGEFVVVAIDNSENYINYSAVASGIRNTIEPLNKPTIVICHVPFYNAELAAYCKGIWGTDETMANPYSNKYPYNATTKYVYEWVTTSPNVIAVVSGHLHINYEGYLAGGKPQYVTQGAYTGAARIVTVKPAPCDVHTWNEGEVITPPTTKDGQTFYTCTVCGETRTDITPAIYKYGDLDGDGNVTAADTLQLRLLLSRSLDFATEREIYASDVNDDGKINIKDSLMLRKYTAGLIPSLGGNT